MSRPERRPERRSARSRGARPDSSVDRAWVVALIVTMFQQGGISAAWQEMRCLGYTAQLPIHHATERDEQATVHWRRYQRAAIKEPPPARAGGSASLTSTGQTLKSHKATTWVQRGVTRS
jgi:hypothetical protein